MNSFTTPENENSKSKLNLKFHRILKNQHFSSFTSDLAEFLQDFNGKFFRFMQKMAFFPIFSKFG